MFPRRSLGKLYLVAVLTFVGVLLIPILSQTPVQADQLTNKSLTLQAGASAGGSDPGGTVNNLFQFTLDSTDYPQTIKSIEFQYCEASDGTCGNLNTDYSMSTTGASIGASTSAFLSAFTLASPATQLEPVLNNSSGFTPGSSDATFVVQLDGIVNPNAANLAFYVRITTWTAINGGGTEVSYGNVAAATANPIVLTGTMPESLIFCTGATVGTTGGQPDCSTATSGSITFPMLFSPSATAYTTSQMAASTNAPSGYVITVNGNTLESGLNSIAAITSAAAPTVGTDQFGMNLEANTTPNITASANVAPASSSPNLMAYPMSGYNTANEYQFNSGDSVANSGYSTGTPTKPTDAQIYTVSYIVDVQGDTPPGTYMTTLTYICTPTF